MAIKVKVYEIPNPKYKEKEPDAETIFEAAVEALGEEIGEIVDGGWTISKIAGGDSVLVVIFEK